jgi:hypothetical protein
MYHMANFISSLCRAHRVDQNSYFVCLNWTLDVKVIKFGEVHVLGASLRVLAEGTHNDPR